MESKQTYWLSSEKGRNWVSGSGQQVVTWIPDRTEISALWWLRMSSNHNHNHSHQNPSENNDNDNGECDPGATPIHCGDTIRLMHVTTKKHLHTHTVPSALSKQQQEVSGFGDDNNNNHGGDDSGNDWILECVQPGHGGLWRRGYSVRLYHVDTGTYLGGSASVTFNQANCGSCHIIHHMEATGRVQKDDSSLIKVDMGVLLSK